jgi:hypothetical protein
VVDGIGVPPRQLHLLEEHLVVGRYAANVPIAGEDQGRQVSTPLRVALLAGYIAVVMRIWPTRSSRHAIGIGALWLVLTLAFEFMLGGLVSGLSWRSAVRSLPLYRRKAGVR